MRPTAEQQLTGADRARIAGVVLAGVTAVAEAQASGQLPKRSLALAHVCIDPYEPDRTVWHNYCDLFRALESGYAALNIPRFTGKLFAGDRAIAEVWIPDWICNKLRAHAEAIERSAIGQNAIDQNAIERKAIAGCEGFRT